MLPFLISNVTQSIPQSEDRRKNDASAYVDLVEFVYGQQGNGVARTFVSWQASLASGVDSPATPSHHPLNPQGRDGAFASTLAYVSGEFTPMLQTLISQRDAIESRASRGTFHDGLLWCAYRVI
jgi:hypothetical protein